MNEKQLETKLPYTPDLQAEWSKLIGIDVNVKMGESSFSGKVERVMASGGFPKFLVIIIKDLDNAYHSIYDPSLITVATEPAPEP